MARSFKVIIVTPDRTAFEGEAVSATIPGLAGYLGVWANHAPLVAAVAPGPGDAARSTTPATNRSWPWAPASSRSPTTSST